MRACLSVCECVCVVVVVVGRGGSNTIRPGVQWINHLNSIILSIFGRAVVVSSCNELHQSHVVKGGKVHHKVDAHTHTHTHVLSPGTEIVCPLQHICGSGRYVSPVISENPSFQPNHPNSSDLFVFWPCFLTWPRCFKVLPHSMSAKDLGNEGNNLDQTTR